MSRVQLGQVRNCNKLEDSDIMDASVVITTGNHIFIGNRAKDNFSLNLATF